MTERADIPSPERPVTREQVINAIRNTAIRWSLKVDRQHRDIDSHIELDDLADTGLLTPEQKAEFDRFRRHEKGVRAITGTRVITLFPSDSGIIVVSFRDPQTGEIIRRNEGLDISGLIGSVTEDIRLKEEEIAQCSSEGEKAKLGERLKQYQNDREILLNNSEPYTSAFPNTLNPNDPVAKGRLDEEARRVWKDPLAATGSMEGDQRVAIDRLTNSRLLRLPEKELSRPALVTPELRPTPAVTIERPATPIPAEVTTTPEPTTSVVAEVPYTYPVSGTTPASATPAEQTAHPDTEKSVYIARLRELFGHLKESGRARVAEIAMAIRGLRAELRRSLDDETAQKVDRLTSTAEPFTKGKGCLALLAAAALAAYLSLLSRDTINQPFPAEIPNIQPSTSPVTESAAVPTPSEEEIVTIPPQPVVEVEPEPVILVPVEVGPSTLPASTSGLPLQPAYESPVVPEPASAKPVVEVEIQPGQTVRGIIEEALRQADPDASAKKIDQAASIVLWKVIGDNPLIFANPNLVHSGDMIKLLNQNILWEFMRGFDPADPVTSSIVEGMNHVPDEVRAKQEAIRTAGLTFEYIIGNQRR